MTGPGDSVAEIEGRAEAHETKSPSGWWWVGAFYCFVSTFRHVRKDEWVDVTIMSALCIAFLLNATGLANRWRPAGVTMGLAVVVALGAFGVRIYHDWLA